MDFDISITGIYRLRHIGDFGGLHFYIKRRAGLVCHVIFSLSILVPLIFDYDIVCSMFACYLHLTLTSKPSDIFLTCSSNIELIMFYFNGWFSLFKQMPRQINHWIIKYYNTVLGLLNCMKAHIRVPILCICDMIIHMRFSIWKSIILIPI